MHLLGSQGPVNVPRQEALPPPVMLLLVLHSYLLYASTHLVVALERVADARHVVDLRPVAHLREHLRLPVDAVVQPAATSNSSFIDCTETPGATRAEARWACSDNEVARVRL